MHARSWLERTKRSSNLPDVSSVDPSLGDRERLSRLSAADADDAGALLGRAFVDDALMRYYFEGSRDRSKLVRTTMTLATRLALRHGTGFRLDCDGQLAGAALLLPPPVRDFPLPAVLGAVLRTPSLWRWRGLRRHFGCSASFEAHRPSFPCWLLLSIGIAPERQHCGHGSWLLGQLLQSVGAASPVCLETLDERNVPLYLRHGFEITSEFVADGGKGPPTWSMLRPGAR
jgi:GNAT superfamily N-acetyltransferase